MNRMAILPLALLLLPLAGAFYMKPVQTSRTWEEARAMAEKTLKELTPEEKHSLMKGSNSYHPGWYVGNTKPIPRLGVPALTMQDAGNGFRPHMPGTHGSTTMFPCGLALAATWDESLVEGVGAAMGREFKGKGANVMLGPSVNVHRVARNGRNFEYMSGEDPYLGARMVKPFVRGVQSEGVIATAKHFAFNEQETNRGTGGVAATSNVDARTAWELYYPPFAAAVEAGAGAVMCSYNRVNGTYACENDGILNRDLKGKMGFNGFVMSDWGATHSTGAVLAGLDQDMPGDDKSFFLKNELKVSRGADEAVLRILSSIYHLRLDESNGCEPPNCLQAMYANVKSKKNSELALRAASHSVVLLQNDGVLPLDATKIKKLAILGKASTAGPSIEPIGVMADYYAGGGSGHVTVHKAITPADAIKKRAQKAGIEVEILAINSPSKKDGKALEVAKAADAVIIVGASSATEGMDRKSLELDGGVGDLIKAVAPLKPTVVLMQTPGAILTDWRHGVSAVANLFLGGEETGNAWASVLFGDTAPMGRLPIMMPASAKDVIEPEERDAEYKEGLFTSYRSKKLKAAYPFGHGLSYTTFEYGQPEIISGANCPGAVCVRIMVRNNGTKHSGPETAQAYVHFPPEANEPDLVLRGFRKTRGLRPGEFEAVNFVLEDRDLSTYDPAAGWVRQQNGVELHIGASSGDIRRVVQL